MANQHFEMDEFLLELLRSRSPTGTEQEAGRLVEKYMSGYADTILRDNIGNRIAYLGDGKKILMLAGHMDEIGFLVSYIDDDGYIFFQQLGGHDNVMLSGRRVQILTKNGPVYGVTGKRAVHLMDAKERKEVPETHQVWIDIGVKGREEAEKLVKIGDPVVYDTIVHMLSGNRCTARAFDDKAGCYCVFEAMRRLARAEYATDFPSCDKRKFGGIKLGGGVVISRGPNINPKVFERLVGCAEDNNIPYQVSAEPRPTGTDARIIQMVRGGVATGLLGIPLRYMHTPAEVADLSDIENCVKLIESFALSLSENDDFTY